MGIGVLFFSGFFLFMFDAENPTATYSVISAQFYFVSGVLIFIKKREAIRFLINSPFPLLICLLALVSILWSYNSNLAVVRSIALLGTLFFALSLIITFTKEELIKLLTIPLFFAAVVALFVGLFLPSIGVDDGSKVLEHSGLWQGTFGFKNNLGRVMGLLVVVLLAQNVFSKKHTNIMLVTTLFVLLMSGSSTPLICVFTVFVVKYYLTIYHKFHPFLRAALLLLSIYLLFLVPYILEFLIVDLMGKDFSGSGRLDMWKDILLSIDSPVLGYGFGGGFWGEFGYANGLLDPRYIFLGHAHNGFVDTLIELGIFGVVFYFLLLLHAFQTSRKAIFAWGDFYYLPFFLVLFLFVYSISGSGFIKQNNILFIFACITAYLPYKRD